MKQLFSLALLIFVLSACSDKQGVLNFSGITSSGKTSEKLSSAIFSLQVTDRRFVMTALEQIFGSAPAVKDIILYDVYHSGRYNGVCDPYSDITREVAVNDTCYNDRGTSNLRCYGLCGGVEQLTSSPSLDTVRISHTVKVCEKLVKVDEAIKFATASAGASHSVLPTSETIQKAHRQFYPFKAISPEVVAKFSEMAALKTEPIESWRLVYLALCISPEWQTI